MGQVIRLPADNRVQLGQPRMCRGNFSHQLGRHQYRRQRIAQFMRQHRQEFFLPVAGRLRGRLQVLRAEGRYDEIVVGFAQFRYQVFQRKLAFCHFAQFANLGQQLGDAVPDQLGLLVCQRQQIDYPMPELFRTLVLQR